MAASLEAVVRCEEAIQCDGENVAVVLCVQCESSQCQACNEFLHSSSQMAGHERRCVARQGPRCEMKCSNRAMIGCAECKMRMCNECDNLMHSKGKKRVGHVRTGLQPVATGGGSQECKSFLLLNDKEELMADDAEQFLSRLGCPLDTSVKVVSIFGNTGDGKSYTLNKSFFSGEQVFNTSPSQASCTIGVWTAYCDALHTIVMDTEGLLGVSASEHQRNRLLMKVFAISDVIIYRTRAERLHTDMFNFIGDASEAYQRYFTPELKDLSNRRNRDTDLGQLGPTVVVFHETQHTAPLGVPPVSGEPTMSAEEQLKILFRELDKSIGSFSSLEYVGTRTVSSPTNFGPFKRKISELLATTSVRAARCPAVIFNTLKVLNEKFSGEINKTISNVFPDEYFTCVAECRACRTRCVCSMNHEKEGSKHSAPDGTCKYIHQLGNKLLLCNVCHGNGQEQEVIPKTYSSDDTSWAGMLKYAWSGYVLECPTCGVIYRSRERWYGNPSHDTIATHSKIIHLWPGDVVRSSDGTHGTRRLLEGMGAVASTIGSVGSVPSKMVSHWVADQIAPSYWKSNSEIKCCFKCGLVFGPDDIKHHCRSCGEGFCDGCSSHTLAVPWRGWGSGPVRVCSQCHTQHSEEGTDLPMVTGGVSGRLMGEAVAAAVSSAVQYSKEAINDASRPSYWVADALITECHKCKETFAPAAVKHHCRVCGQGFCDRCSSQRRPVSFRGWDGPVRVCDLCCKQLRHNSSNN